jgi:hypothetical protein
VVVIYVPEIKACEKRSGKLRKFASHFPVPFRLIESPSLTAFARITSGDRWKCSTRASSVCVFDNAINSRSVFIDHPGPVGSRFIATPPAHSTASPVRRQELVESRDDQAEQHHASQYQQTHSLDRPSRKPSSRSISSLASLRSRAIARNASSGLAVVANAACTSISCWHFDRQKLRSRATRNDRRQSRCYPGCVREGRCNL